MKIILIVLYSVLYLYCQESAAQYSKNALILWFDTMLPTQFVPFVLMELIQNNPWFLQKAAKHSSHVQTLLTCFVTGILFGFPAGAIFIISYYQKGILSKKQCNLLLPSCNLFGIAYLFGFLRISYSDSFAEFSFFRFLLPYYLFPVLFLILHWKTLCSSFPEDPAKEPAFGDPTFQKEITKSNFSKNNFQKSDSENQISNSQLSEKQISNNRLSEKQKYNLKNEKTFRQIITQALVQTSILSGYMMFFASLQFLCDLFPIKVSYQPYIRGLVEITCAMDSILPLNPKLASLYLSFGGICCFAQTRACLSETDLSLLPYLLTKICFVIATALFIYLPI